MTEIRRCGTCGSRLAQDQRGTLCSPCARSSRESHAHPGPQTEEFWQREEIRAALGSRHFGRVLREYRGALGRSVTQTVLGEWLGLSQERISRMERSAKPPADLQKMQRWAGVLHIPAQLLWFAVDDAPEASESAHSADSLDDVDRRDLLKLAGATVAGASVLRDAPWQRLAESLAGHRAADGATTSMIENRTASFFRSEETQPARQLVRSLVQHRKSLADLIEDSSNESIRRRLITASGETEALEGWTLFDLGRVRDAERRYTSAFDSARQAGDGPLAACVLGYWSYLVSSKGDTVGAVRMLEDASEFVRGSAPATQAWISARLAEESAAGGDAYASLRALDRAVTMFDYAAPGNDRPWTCFFTPSRLGSLAVSTYGRISHPETDTEAEILLRSLSPTENKVRALVLADLATSAARSGDVDRVGSLAGQSAPLAVRTEASLALDRLWGVVEMLPEKGTGTGARIRERLTDKLLAV